MRRRLSIFGMALLAAGASAQDPPRAEPLLERDAVAPVDEAQAAEFGPAVFDPGVDLSDRVFSESRQFVVHGGDAAQRSSLAIEAERVRNGLFGLLGLPPDEVVFPIEIRLRGKVGDPLQKRPVALELRYTDETYLMRIHLDLARGIDHERLERTVLSALLYQLGLKGVKPQESDGRLLVPVWLVEGLREADVWREGRADRKLYERVFKRQGLFTIDQLLSLEESEHERLDGGSRAAFRAFSGALVMALLEQPRGREGFVGFVGEVPRYDGEMPILLRQHFPELNLSEQSLAKWWALTLARLADAPLTEVMGIEATEEALDAALMIHYRDATGAMQSAPFENRELFKDLDEAARMQAIRPAQDRLNRLSYRCFPSYRPLLLDYQGTLQDWARDRRGKELAATLAELSETRQIMLHRARGARDYLNWLEIVEAQDLSGDFDDYLRLKKELELRPRPERDDPISKYLDALDQVYGDNKGRR